MKILSVSIAAYNVEKTLRETLDPFLRCTRLDSLDIMIVNDGSKDGTSKIAMEYEKYRPDVFRVISKENGGWGSTLNTGIDQAKGKYFKQLDGDDHYDPEHLDNLLELLKVIDVDLVVTPYITYDDRTGEQLEFRSCNPGLPDGVISNLSEVKPFVPFMHAICMKTSVLKASDIHITENCFYTDTEFVLKAINQVHTVTFFEQAIYYYRRATVGQSMSLAGLEKHHMDQYTVIENVLNYRKNFVKRNEVLRIYDSLLIDTCIWHYLVMMYIKPTFKHRSELVKYDKMLKKLAPDVYSRINIGAVRLLRKTDFIGYFAVAQYKKKKDNCFTKDGRMI